MRKSQDSCQKSTDENAEDEDKEYSKDSNSAEGCAPQPMKKPIKRSSGNQSVLLSLYNYTERPEEVGDLKTTRGKNKSDSEIDCLQPKQPKYDT